MILRELAATRPVLTDGAWATELQCFGLPPRDCPDGWNLLQPDVVREVARSYVDAGSRVILTNTFRANAISLAAWRLEDAVAEINRAGAGLSREAAGTRAYVFGSIGPTGEQVALNHLRREAAYAAFAEQAAALAAGGVHALLLETFSDLEEAHIALRAARTTGLPAIVSFAFPAGANQDRTTTGATPEQVAHAMTEAGADAVGANCGAIEACIGVCRRMHSATHLPLWMKPNAGMPGMASERFASHARSVIDAGATFLGACCGSGPGLIRVLAEMLAARMEACHAHQGH
ncbi:MAG TPA: homocysteine S-methyltransferase family protein [Bryobacteraceae bacterium]|nr:homocysteine S-methyltransferase family protein [Bryobacteraceae bacterium]